ncbi:ATP-binding protein [Thermopolyspora sp. NPDC052614]|uniref:ATP-binding protein n=1 Tax=Thermopolyspora sp. NPDC052614 TaxID=3155682 RepID=UPI003423271E
MGFTSGNSAKADEASLLSRRVAAANAAETGTVRGGESAAAATTARVRMLAWTLEPGGAARQARTLLEGVLRGAGLDEAAVFDAKLAVAELAGNAERHGRPPYEMRVFIVGGVPIWCEVIDGDPDLRRVAAALHDSGPVGGDPLPEHGRGLPLLRQLSDGHCLAYPATTSCTGVHGKAVAFGLPTRSGVRHMGPPWTGLPEPGRP